MKPLYILDGTRHDITTNTSSPPAQTHSSPATVATPPNQIPRTTRSGRCVRFLACFNLSYSNPKTIMPEDNLGLIYYSYFHSLITYGIVFWGNSSQNIRVFRLQKRTIRSIAGSKL